MTPPKFNSSPLKNGGWKTILSYWVSVTFQGRAVKLGEGIREIYQTYHTFAACLIRSQMGNLDDPCWDHVSQPPFWRCELIVSGSVVYIGEWKLWDDFFPTQDSSHHQDHYIYFDIFRDPSNSHGKRGWTFQLYQYGCWPHGAGSWS